MVFFDRIKKCRFIGAVYGKLVRGCYSCLTLISPTLNTRVAYRRAFKRRLDLENPAAFTEKLLWLKLNQYRRDPLVIKCADKYRVREYIAQCGYAHLLNTLYGVYERAEDIPWDTLPGQFVLKWNFGSGMNIICQDKGSLDKAGTIKKLRKWGRSRYWLCAAELQYKYIPKRIVCERYLADEGSPAVPPDYKVYCFHGEPKAIYVMHDRGSTIKTEFFDVNWNPLENGKEYGKPSAATAKPPCLGEMLDASRAFSRPFPFVRCDFFVVSGKLYFGELTFSPAGGLYVSETKIDGKDMTDFLHIPSS